MNSSNSAKSPVIKIEPWIKGIQNTHDISRTPVSSLIEAINVNIDLDGIITPRKGYVFKAADAHSLFEYKNSVYAIYQNLVCELFPDEVKPLSTFTVNSKVRWCVLNDEVIFTNNEVLGKITNNQAIKIGIEKPVVSGYVKKDKQAFAYSYVNKYGEEGPLSAVTSDILSYVPFEHTMKTYSTAVALLDFKVISGDELFLQNETSVGGSPITFGCNTLPGGSYITYWRGRLLVARGRTLFVSKAFHYGVYEEDAGIYPFEGKIIFLVSIDKGIFVGVKNVGVYFLRGNTPEEWERVLTSNDEAQEGAAVVVSAANFKIEGTNVSQLIAVWFTQFGFTVGLPSGETVYPQVDYINNLQLGNGSLYYNDGRLTVLNQ